MGIQMAVFIFFGTYVGYLIDQDANRLSDSKTQWATISLSLLKVIPLDGFFPINPETLGYA